MDTPDITGCRKSTTWGRCSPYGSLVTRMTVSRRLRKTYPGVFSDEDLTKRVESAVFKAFELLPGDDYEVVPRLDVVAR